MKEVLAENININYWDTISVIYKYLMYICVTDPPLNERKSILIRILLVDLSHFVVIFYP